MGGIDLPVVIALSFVSTCWTCMIMEFHIYSVKLREWKCIMSKADGEYCMCGDPMDSHTFSHGHAPMSERDYYEEQRPQFE